ncbi:hypothetical protein HanXRQr2_Chr02g0066751 [Helianthus annuus]|uniref:Uncharacterized protein n=1 Tax=Helianthus annuus TaxID=4232 RepID=A0A9K3JQ59_HELAN|nr:hypothetical protein HanXRQr2_Chr02g0066751 [Helianthus annuus]KAJ0951882.1 hypothetical protein HanPSC8_Chr02g0065601 [Helianthus annuus]
MTSVLNSHSMAARNTILMYRRDTCSSIYVILVVRFIEAIFKIKIIVFGGLNR